MTEFESDVAIRYINAAQCAQPSATEIEVTLQQVGGQQLNQVDVWVGGQASNCNLRDSRVGDAAVCGQVLASETVLEGPSIRFDLSELLGATDSQGGVVDCESQALAGQPYELITVRGVTPNQDLLPQDYGVATFTVDVRAPDPVTITSDPVLTGSSFTISWDPPADLNEIDGYELYESDSPGSSLEDANKVGVTAGPAKTSITVSSADLGLAIGETTYLSVQASDLAGNEGELSDSVQVTAVESGGFCEQPGVECGCSASAVASGSAQRSLTAFVMLLLAAVLLLRRRFIR